MLGAIIGDIVGSTREFNNVKTKDFVLFPHGSTFTDDTVMTIAIAEALLKHKRHNVDFEAECVLQMRKWGNKYLERGYGVRFENWLLSKYPRPYNSFGNGSAMRVSACGLLANSLNEALEFAKISAQVTHNHPDGIKGAQAVAGAIFLAKSDDKNEIKHFISKNFYNLDKTLDEIRPYYKFDETSQGSVPQAITAFIESKGFEDALRNAVSIGGDSDTIAAITGSIAWAYYGTEDIVYLIRNYLPEDMLLVVDEFMKEYSAILQL